MKRAPRRTCSVDGCVRVYYSLGYCLAHYTRVRRSGTPGTADVWDRKAKPCLIEGCSEKVRSDGMCLNHSRRMRKHGTPEYVPPMRYGAANGSWKNNDIGYTMAHGRVRKLHGSAKDHSCVDCGGAARHWSYDHNDPEELRTSTGLPYSIHPEHYAARCVSCHKRFDLAVKAGIDWDGAM